MNWREWLRLPSQPDPAAQEEAVARRQRAVEMGRHLREQRVRAGLTPIDVERDTRINRLYIEAIEDARFDVLPAPVYARGFMRSYARYLGVDPEQAAAAVPGDLPRPTGLEPMPGLRRTAPPALPSLPALNPPVVAAAGAAVLVLLALVLLVPRVLPVGGDGDASDATPTLAAGDVEPRDTPDGGPAEPPLATSAATDGQPEFRPEATVPPFVAGATPDFRGVSLEAAEAVLDDIGATPLIVEAPSTLPPGIVFDQTPAPDTDLSEGDVVTLFISQR